MEEMPDPPTFDPSTSGVTAAFPCNAFSKPKDFLLAYFTGPVVQLICEETNKFYHQSLAAGKVKTPGHMKRWTDITHPEFYIFLALLLLMPITKKSVLAHYWSLQDIRDVPFFRKYMSRDRFTSILRFLHFTDNSNAPSSNDPGYDRLWKIRPIMSAILDLFSRYFRPYQNLCIDESLVLFRGRVIFRQYIKSKRHRYDICQHDFNRNNTLIPEYEFKINT